MKKYEVDYFIKELKTIGDEWTPEQVMDTYADTSLSDAIKSRKNDVKIYFGIINSMLKN